MAFITKLGVIAINGIGLNVIGGCVLSIIGYTSTDEERQRVGQSRHSEYNTMLREFVAYWRRHMWAMISNGTRVCTFVVGENLWVGNQYNGKGGWRVSESKKSILNAVKRFGSLTCT